jgi:hypothetical protein
MRMFKRSIFAAVAALTIAGGNLAATTTASAAHFGLFIGVPGTYYGPYYYSPPPPAPSCWRWSYYWNRWVWACGAPAYGYDFYRHHHHHHVYD